jgi:hypothetical protein
MHRHALDEGFGEKRAGQRYGAEGLPPESKVKPDRIIRSLAELLSVEAAFCHGKARPGSRFQTKNIENNPMQSRLVDAGMGHASIHI